MEESESIDLAPWMAAIIIENGGEMTIKAETLINVVKALSYVTMEFNQDGTLITLKVVDESEVPEDVRVDG